MLPGRPNLGHASPAPPVARIASDHTPEVGGANDKFVVTTLTPGKVGVYYSKTYTLLNQSSYAVVSLVGALPAGLSWYTSVSTWQTTLTIFGTPTVGGTFSFSFQAVSLGLEWPCVLSIAQADPLSISTPSTLSGATAGVPYTNFVSASGGAGPYSWSISEGLLPPGLTFSSAGNISGTPTSAGSFSFTASVRDSGSASVSKSFTLTVAPPSPLSILTTSPLPGGMVKASYSQTFSGSGGIPPYSWSTTSGALPDGLTLTATSGVLSGVPKTNGIFNFTVQLRDGASLTVTKAFTVTVTLPIPLSITTASPLPSGLAKSSYSQTLGGSGGIPPYTWSMAGFSSLPAGLTLSGGGTISGTPSSSGTFTFTIQLADSSLAAATKEFTLSVTDALPVSVTTNSPLPDAALDVSYSGTLSASGGIPPYTWSLVSGALPGGLTLTDGGKISGTPIRAGMFNFGVRVQDSQSATATKTFTLTVVSPTSGIYTVAGTGAYGFSGDGGPATSAQLNSPSGVTVDRTGNLFIADRGNHRIRKVSPEGVIVTVAGFANSGYSGDGGPATSARLSYPSGVAVDASGNLYIADTGSHHVRKVSAAGIITTVAGQGEEGYSGDGGPASSAQLRSPSGVAVDQSGNLFIADYGNDRIRKISIDGVITTIAGNGTSGYSGDGGPATGAQLSGPRRVALDASGNLYVADLGNNCIRKISPGGTITTVAGSGTSGYSGDGGPATSAKLNGPVSLTIDASGALFISDYSNFRIRKVSREGVITTVAGVGTYGSSGDGGPATSAQLAPGGLVVDSLGNLYVADGDRIRCIYSAGLGPLAITTASPLPYGTLGLAYSQALTAKGGTPPYTWSIRSGSLPSGLTLNSAGMISGTPIAEGAFDFTLQVRDSVSLTAIATFVLSAFGPADPLSILTVSPLLSGWVGGAYGQALYATGGHAPYTWSVTSGSLPQGVTLNSSGLISGTPTTAGTFTVTVQVSDAASTVVTRTVTLTVVAPGTMNRMGVLSHVASGGSWETAIWLTNSSSARVSIQLKLHGDAGDDMSVGWTATQKGDSQTLAGAVINRVIDPDTTLVVATGSNELAARQGWAEVLADGAVGGFAVFRYAPKGVDARAAGFITPWEGTVPLQTQLNATSMVLPFDNTAGFSTGFALGNLTAGSVTTVATFYDDSGAQLGAAQPSVPT